MVASLHACPKPTIAVLEGAAVGVGLSLALAADLRIATQNAKIAFVFTKIGLHPDGGSSWLLPRLIGVGRAMQMMLLGDTYRVERDAVCGGILRQDGA
jgi:enoyl-CoA hydratase/carnithine racemase